jgi:parvulin-like peptidyl-prolyl isomerase
LALSNLTKGIVLLVVILAIGAGLVVWKSKVGGHASAQSFNSIKKEEIEMLLADVAKTNPAILKRLKDDPEMKKNQLESLKQLLAFASEAQREGIGSDPIGKQEMENIKAEITAVNYDREVNKDKGPMPPFGFISEDQVKAYWEEDSQPKPAQSMFGPPVDPRTHEQEFQDFLNAKIELMKKGNPDQAREVSDEEKNQARDVFAKMRIYKAEYERRAAAGELDKALIDRINLQVKLQQAQFLAREYSEKISKQMEVTDAEVEAYIKANPDLDPEQKRAKAQGILDRAKAGEDFAALANEFSEDPGNKGPDGTMQGGIYKDVPKGRMVAPFEAAALALQPGQVAADLVPTDFGFHIIKLERALGKSGDAKEETYDVRHILISTSVKDPKNPMGRDTPVKDFAKAKLEEEKEKKLIDEIVARNNVSVPADFDVPEPTAEQLQQMQQRQQQQMMPPQGMPPGGPDAPAPKPAPKDTKKAEPQKK